MSILEDKQLYCKRKGLYNEDGNLDEDAVNEEFNYLEQVIKQHTNDEEFIPWIKKLLTYLVNNPYTKNE